jgi:type I restriction enzyme S subunit
MYGQGKTRGQSAVLKIAATTNQACFAIFPNETWHPEFLQLWLMYSYKDLRSISENRGGNQANLNGNILNELLVPAPPLKVQIETTEKLNKALMEMEKIKLTWDSIQSEIKTFPQRILDNAFKQNIDDKKENKSS